MDARGDLDGDGLYECWRRSPQGWRDSDDAIVHADGAEVEPPVATCEAQAYTFLAKVRLSQILAHLGRAGEARRLAREASDLQKRFLDRFWLEDQRFLAMALDRDKRPVASIASEPGHCLAGGILPRPLARRVAERLMLPDMFSGWGVRTLSSAHPAYNPFSYHRGSVWPVEQGTIALGMSLVGLGHHAAQIARGTFEAASIFAHNRLPEVMSGHPRDGAHPFPAVYPRTCWPQAWSASAVVALVRALLGIVPSAVTRRLFVDPHLPAWLPEITLRGLRVGAARADLRFARAAGGAVEVNVLDVRGELDVVRRRAAEPVEASTHASVPGR
jgi:glycogen debranching enzyme